MAEERMRERVLEIEQESNARQEALVQELESLKAEVTQELIAKSAQIEAEYEEVQQEKQRIR